jgi:hypothetical protein
VDNVLPAEISTWLNEAIAAGKVTAASLAEVTAAADYELAYLLDEAPMVNMDAATELDISNIMIDENGNISLTAELSVNSTAKDGAIKGQIKLYSKATLTDEWTEEVGGNTFDEGEMEVAPTASQMRSGVKPCFFKVKLEK